MTNAERQRELRQRRKEAGYTEIRGLYAPTEKHAQIKAQIRKELQKTSLGK